MNKYLEKLAAQMEETPEEKQESRRVGQYVVGGGAAGGIGGAYATHLGLKNTRKQLGQLTSDMTKQRWARQKAEKKFYGEPKHFLHLVRPTPGELQEFADALGKNPHSHATEVDMRRGSMLIRPKSGFSTGVIAAGSLIGSALGSGVGYGIGKLTAKKKED